MSAPTSFEEAVREALAGHPKRRFDVPDHRDAAVLVPLFERGRRPWAVFTKRTTRVRHHKGEISFPGGMRDPEDGSLAATALRETREELGLDPATVRVLGELDDIPTFGSRYLVTPFVAAVPPDVAWAPNEREIDEILEFPLAELARIERHEPWERFGTTVDMYLYELEGYTIWGATARILHQLLDVAGAALGLRGPG